MSLLLETIKLEEGKLANLLYHNRRFNNARKNLFSLPPLDLADLIDIPSSHCKGVYRCRVVYGKQIEKIELIPHQPREINSLHVVHDNSISYSYKYADRSHLQKLFNLRGASDEIIIVRNNLITDCFIGNLVFFDGERWLTPDQPLLEGTQRQKLIDNRLIFPVQIKENDLGSFEATGIINVFYNLVNMPIIKKQNIHQ